MALYNIASRQTTERWHEYAIKSRDAADRWIEISQRIPTTDEIPLRAHERAYLSEPRAPARHGEPNFEDCLILETYLSYVEAERAKSDQKTFVFASSNTRDFAGSNRNEISEELREEFDALDLKYAPNMRTARALLGLV